MTSQACRRAPGSDPVVGSSRNRSSGSPASAIATSSRRCCPPDSLMTRASRFSPGPRGRRPRPRSGRRVVARVQATVSRTVRYGSTPVDCRTIPTRRRSSSSGPRGRTRAPRPRPRSELDTPRGSRPSSSCRRRSGRGARTPRERIARSIPATASRSPYIFGDGNGDHLVGHARRLPTRDGTYPRLVDDVQQGPPGEIALEGCERRARRRPRAAGRVPGHVR